MQKLRALADNYLIKIEQNLSDIPGPSNEIIEGLYKFINGKSKKIRSIVCILYLLANNIKVTNDVINLLTAVEIIHNASLLHDDVIDNSEFRRGEETFSKKYNEKISVLCGDYLLSKAVKILMKLNDTKILNLFLDTTEKMSNAEIKQYLCRSNNIQLDDYIEIITGKTASLFETTLEIAALVTNFDTKNAKQFGHFFGILYQINNDIQPESCANDKANGVQTAIEILGIEKTLILKDNYKHKIREILKTFPDNKYKIGLEDLVKVL